MIAHAGRSAPHPRWWLYAAVAGPQLLLLAAHVGFEAAMVAVLLVAWVAAAVLAAPVVGQVRRVPRDD